MGGARGALALTMLPEIWMTGSKEKAIGAVVGRCGDKLRLRHRAEVAGCQGSTTCSAYALRDDGDRARDGELEETRSVLSYISRN